MENKQMKMNIQNKEEIDRILKHGNGNKNNYMTTTLLSKQYELLYVTDYFEKYCKLKFPESVLKIPIQNNNIGIKTQPAHVDNTSITINMTKRQNILLYKKDVLNELIFLPHIKDSYKNLSKCHQKYIFSPTAGTKDSSLALLQYFPGNCCNYRNNQNVYHKYSGIDLNKILALVELMYEMMKYLLQNIESNHPSLSNPHSYTLLIYLENIIQYLIYCKQVTNNIIKYDQYKIKAPHKCVQFEKPTNIIYSKNVQIMSPITTSNIFLNISTEKQNMQLGISICKYNSFSINMFIDLATIYSTYKNLFSTYEPNKTVSLCIKSWHIQNIALGYLLCKLLSNFNVSTLYLMRNLYFVIIMSTSLNLRININFKLQNGIFMVYDTNPYRSFTKPINWNINRSQLKRSRLVNTTILMPMKCLQVQQLEAKADTKPSPCNLHILKMLKNYITLGFEASESINHSCSNFDSESLISLQTKLSSISKSDENEETILLKEVGQENVIHEGAAGDTLLNNKINLTSTLYDLPFLKRRALFMNLCKQSEEIKARLNLFIADFNCINESIFERFTACEYGDVANQYWVHVSSQTPCKVFLKCLGQSLLNVFFGATL